MRRNQRYWLLVPLMLCYWNGSLTLVGQSGEYFQGDYLHASDLNPIAKFFLNQDPGLFFGLAVFWAGVIWGIVMLWNHKLVQWAAVILTVLHAVGGSTWLFRIEHWGWLLAIGHLAVMAQFAKWCWRPSVVNRS